MHTEIEKTVDKQMKVDHNQLCFTCSPCLRSDNITVTIKPAITSAVSSLIPSAVAAENPNRLHKKGIINTSFGKFLSLHKRTPKVNIVTGQGTPNVGEAG